TAQGRSRAFVNGAMSTAGRLKELSSRLIELHGQHEHQTLLDASTHLDVLDNFGGMSQLAAPVGAADDALHASREELARVRAAARDRDTRQDLITFQLGELDRAALRDPGEDAELPRLRPVLARAQRL